MSIEKNITAKNSSPLLLTAIYLYRTDKPVLYMNNLPGPCRYIRGMSNNNHCHPVPVNFLQNIHHFYGSRTV